MFKLNSLEAIFNKLSYGRQPFDTFVQILDTYLIPFQYVDTGEELQALAQKLESTPNLDLIREFFTELGNITEPFCDPLGEFYMQFISHGHLGQYFTPEPITLMMAKITMEQPIEDGKTVLDPACGSGRTLLAAATMNRNLYFFGADLDPTCCKMALINMLNNSLLGEIAHMNSLSNEFYRSYRTGLRSTPQGYLPYFRLITDAEQSHVTLKAVQEAKTKPPIYTQGRLFDF